MCDSIIKTKQRDYHMFKCVSNIFSNAVSAEKSKYVNILVGPVSFQCFLSRAHILDGQSSPKTNCEKEQAPIKDSVTGPSVSSLKRLRSSCVVVRVDDVDIHQARLGLSGFQMKAF